MHPSLGMRPPEFEQHRYKRGKMQQIEEKAPFRAEARREHAVYVGAKAPTSWRKRFFP
jgi:hypothetical protein